MVKIRAKTQCVIAFGIACRRIATHDCPEMSVAGQSVRTLLELTDTQEKRCPVRSLREWESRELLAVNVVV